MNIFLVLDGKDCGFGCYSVSYPSSLTSKQETALVESSEFPWWALGALSRVGALSTVGNGKQEPGTSRERVNTKAAT